METKIIDRLLACERANRHLIRLFRLQCIVVAFVVAAVFASGWGGTRYGLAAQAPVGPLRVTELVVVDPNGVERVRVGGDLPDAVIEGETRPRGEKAAGVLLYDGTGQERGGYVTWEPSGNIGLTLDTRGGQVTLFVAGPESTSALQLWHQDDLIALRADEDGARLTGVRDGQVVFQSPTIATVGNEACTAYREAQVRLSVQEALQACRRRFTVEACDACLNQR